MHITPNRLVLGRSRGLPVDVAQAKDHYCDTGPIIPSKAAPCGTREPPVVSAFVEEASSGRVKGYPSPMFLAILFLVVNFGGGWNNFDGSTQK